MAMTGSELAVALCAGPFALPLQPPLEHARSKLSPSAWACSSAPSADASAPPVLVVEGATCAR